jgi:hypothetical protein
MDIGFGVIVCTLVTLRAHKLSYGQLDKAFLSLEHGGIDILFEIDSLMVVNMLTTNNVCLPLLSTFVNDCRELLNRM